MGEIRGHSPRLVVWFAITLTCPMSKRIIDLETWNRKEHYLFFKQYDDPFWSVTVNVDASHLYQKAKREKFPFSLAYLFGAIKAGNQVEAFRMRIESDQPVVYDVIHASNTILRSDGTFGFSIHPYTPNFEEFVQQGIREYQRVRMETGLCSPYTGNAVIYFTVVRGTHFTSFDHARVQRSRSSIPLIAFGEMRNGQLPMAIHAHHALVDGQHIGQFIDFFQKYLYE